MVGAGDTAMRHALRLVAPFSLGLALACGNSESNRVEDYLDASDAALHEVCECGYDDQLLLLTFGYLESYDSVEACDAEVGIDSAERGCVEGLFADEPTDYSAVLDCRAASARNAGACLNGKTCTDTARSGCFEQYFDEVEDCPDLPDGVEDKLNDCLRN
jgi:hypothetical protein